MSARRCFPLACAAEWLTPPRPAALRTATRLHATAPGAPRTLSPPTYYNFKTLKQFPDGPPSPQPLVSSSSLTHSDDNTKAGQRDTATPPRLYVSHRSGTADGLPLHNTSPESGADDPYRHVRIFRRDMAEGGSSANGSRPFPLSVDVPLKRYQELFCDYDGKRCKLCNESFLQWYSHQGAVPHSARECLALELVRANCGTPEEIVDMWWHRLDTSPSFHRIRSLSHANSHTRKRRLLYLLKYLKDRDIVREAFNVRQQPSSAGRTWEFERLEFLGDNVIKYLFNNRLSCLFPVSEGGTRGKIGLVQFLIDGNDGLARAHDFLGLQELTLSDRVVSKFKSDVVETLFGELQVFLWSSQLDLGTEKVPHPFTRDMLVLRDLVYHVMEELAHVMIMYHIEYVLGSVQRIAREHQLQFVNTDPQQAKATAKHAASLRGAFGPFSAVPPPQDADGYTLRAKKTPYRSAAGAAANHSSQAMTGHGASHARGRGVEERDDAGGASVYWEAMNYDKFTHVTPLGGLLPRPFREQDLSPVPTYLPHLQPDLRLTQRLPADIAQDVRCGMMKEESGAAAEDRLLLSSTRMPGPPQTEVTTLSVAKLKDAELVAELL